MSATATANAPRHADLRIIRVDPHDLHSEVGAGFYGAFTFRTSALMARAGKSLLLARMGYGKSKIAAGVAVQLAEGGLVTAVASPVMRTFVESELRDAGYDLDITVHTPHALARNELVPAGNAVLYVDLDAVIAPGVPHAARQLVAKAAAQSRRVVMFGTPTESMMDFINLLSTYCDDVTIVNGS